MGLNITETRCAVPPGLGFLLLFTGDFRPRLQVMPSLPTPISAKPALLGDPGFGTAATHMLSQIPAYNPPWRTQSWTSRRARLNGWGNALPDHPNQPNSGWPGTGAAGYGAFSVCKSTLDAVARYIRSQEAHHRKMGYDQEFIALLEKHHSKEKTKR